MKQAVRMALFFVFATCGATSFGSAPEAARPLNPPSVKPAHAPAAKSKAGANSDWTLLARAVGQAEENRDQVISKLRAIVNLRARLLESLPGPNRALALDVISALEMHDLVTDLLVYMSADEDGFVTLTISSLLDEKNQDDVLKNYSDDLNPANITRFSPATIVAMLEPIGRLGIRLSSSTLQALAVMKSPEVRGATLYYLRMMALVHHQHEQDGLTKTFLKNSEFQIRLQAISTLTEFQRSRDPGFSNLPSRDELISICKAEKSVTVQGYCLSLAEKPKGQR